MMTDTSYALASESVKTHRKSLLHEAHISPLTDFVTRMRDKEAMGEKIPFFDPFDGGQHAEILFLLEAPGPCAVKSGFISRDNPDPSAKNFSVLNNTAQLDRKKTILWNIVPWYIEDENHNIRPAKETDIEQGKKWLSELLTLLNNLKIIVLVGKKSQSIHVWLSARTNAHIYALHHPSNRVKNSYRDKFAENEDVLKNIARKNEDHYANQTTQRR